MRLKNSDQTAVREDIACGFERAANCSRVMGVIVDPIDTEQMSVMFETPLNSRECRNAVNSRVY